MVPKSDRLARKADSNTERATFGFRHLLPTISAGHVTALSDKIVRLSSLISSVQPSELSLDYGLLVHEVYIGVAAPDLEGSLLRYYSEHRAS